MVQPVKSGLYHATVFQVFNDGKRFSGPSNFFIVGSHAIIEAQISMANLICNKLLVQYNEKKACRAVVLAKRLSLYLIMFTVEVRNN